MKIYTYYEDINFTGQAGLINFWEKSWQDNGFEPIVLNKSHAVKHPYFKTLDTEMRKLFNIITGKTIGDYGMSCWYRWLAYATQPDEKVYVSDYDAINANFPVQEPDDKLHLMDSACPFFASGTPSQFEHLCKQFVELTTDRLDVLKKQADHFHDQEFFVYNFSECFNKQFQQSLDRCNVKMTRNRDPKNGIGGGYNPVTNTPPKETYKIFHVAHKPTADVKRAHPAWFKDMEFDKLRVLIAKNILEK